MFPTLPSPPLDNLFFVIAGAVACAIFFGILLAWLYWQFFKAAMWAAKEAVLDELREELHHEHLDMYKRQERVYRLYGVPPLFIRPTEAP